MATKSRCQQKGRYTARAAEVTVKISQVRHTEKENFSEGGKSGT